MVVGGGLTEVVVEIAVVVVGCEAVVVGCEVVGDDVVLVRASAPFEQAATKTSRAARTTLMPVKGQDRRRNILGTCSAPSMVSGWHWSASQSLPLSPP
jgi:hypothetical protein